ncbi:hypothetical protein BE221DRAFT_82077 [Ostreococcus tauri]|uniref:Rrn7/TAF1B C-terminal cyclin domain-containing protein n=1 Tax=Ostreococcus tauri TaxID=70448 RepID=A0A1Y5I8K3_OSTTA|nr:hypothetical protein BE221DRAFT_82077 [Ostreococcus tauri]
MSAEVDIACAVCRARGVDVFEPSDAGFLVCARCGTQSQHQAQELGLASDDENELFLGAGGGGNRRRGLRYRKVHRQSDGASRARSIGVHEGVRRRDAWKAFEAYASAFQTTLERQTRALALVVDEDGNWLREEVREVWDRYVRACGAMEAMGNVDDAEVDQALAAVDDAGDFVFSVRPATRGALAARFGKDGRGRDNTLPKRSRNDQRDVRGRDICDASARRRHMPRPDKIVAAAAYVAEKIGVELPPINAAALLGRFVGALNLGDDVLIAAQRVLTVYLSPHLRYGYGKHTPESTLMAYVVVASKFLYGLDGRTKTKGLPRNKKKTTFVSPPAVAPVSTRGWTAWARAVSNLGAPSRSWTEAEIIALDSEERDRYLRFVYHEQIDDRVLPFPFDRIEAKLLKMVPHRRLNGDTRLAHVTPPAPVRTENDDLLNFVRDKRALAELYERRVRFNTALAVYDARDFAEKHDTHYDQFGARRSQLEADVASRAGGTALRKDTTTSERNLIASLVARMMQGSKTDMMNLVGGDKAAAQVRLTAFVRQIVAKTLPRNVVFNGSKRQCESIARSCVKSVDEEDKALAAYFPGTRKGRKERELHGAVKVALEDIAAEQRLSDAVSKFAVDGQVYDASSKELAATCAKLICTRSASFYLPASSSELVSSPREYMEVVEAIAQYMWIVPESLHDSVKELEFVLFRIEEFLRVEEETRVRIAKEEERKLRDLCKSAPERKKVRRR